MSALDHVQASSSREQEGWFLAIKNFSVQRGGVSLIANQLVSLALVVRL